MHVLIIGGTRFIGPRVVARLVAGGHRVTVAHRGEHACVLPARTQVLRLPALGAPIVSIPNELTRLQPDTVIHMMAMGEADGLAAAKAFAGVARRIVAPSSGDVYGAYGVLVGLENAAVSNTPLREDSPLRTSRFPYWQTNTPQDSIEFSYDKILAEQALSSEPTLPATILRLPKVYGPEDNADLGTVYGFRHAPLWKWTHGHVDNVAKAITVAALDDRSAGRTYNVGEPHTPSMGERLRHLPEPIGISVATMPYRFEQNLEYDTSRIRVELNYVEDVDELEAMRLQATRRFGA